MAPSGEFEEEEGFETDASLYDQCDVFVESKDTYIEEHSFDEPSVAKFREVTPHMELDVPILIESSLDLAPIPSISPLSSPLLIFLPFLDPHESIFIESESFMLGSRYLD